MSGDPRRVRPGYRIGADHMRDRLVQSLGMEHDLADRECAADLISRQTPMMRRSAEGLRRKWIVRSVVTASGTMPIRPRMAT